jgi:hypothetical protein
MALPPSHAKKKKANGFKQMDLANNFSQNNFGKAMVWWIRS